MIVRFNEKDTIISCGKHWFKSGTGTSTESNGCWNCYNKGNCEYEGGHIKGIARGGELKNGR